MKFPPTSSVHRLPRYLRRGEPEPVRAAPIVDFARATEDRRGYVVVQLDAERHVITVLDGFWDMGDPPASALLVVDADGGMTWTPREAFERGAARVEA